MKSKKLKTLEKILKELKSVVVAYSGGVDSAFLLKSALSVLGKKNVLAVTARSETYPIDEGKQAEALAKKLKVRYKIINTSELGIKNFKANPENRCYFCKKELFGNLKSVARKNRINNVVDGSNFDDLSDWRPGSIAAKELKVRSPLAEAGLTKDDIRALSRKSRLSTWNKPSFACLASRIPYHNTITKEKLAMVDKAEKFLKSLGFRQVRVRCHSRLARIEAESKDVARLALLREKIVTKLKKLGFIYVALDLAGYRTGSMNEAMKERD